MARLVLSDTTYKWYALSVTIIGGFMSMLDTSIVNIAIPKMMAVFAVDPDQAQWIVTSYMLTMGMVQPLTGYCCDRFGTRRMYLFSLTVFTVGSALCAVAWDCDSMIGFRVLQAVGGGLVHPVTMTLIYHNFAREERYLAMGLWGVTAMVAPAIGPTLSGYLTQYWDWRLIFAVNLPIGLGGYFLAHLILRNSRLKPPYPFDWTGFATAALGLFCLLLGLKKGASEGWTSAYIIALLYIAAASLTLFIVIELGHERPMLDLRIFRNRNYLLSSIVVFIGTTGLYGGLFLVPLFMQNLRNYTAMQTGALLLPPALVSGLTMPLAGLLSHKIGPKKVVITGLILLGCSSLPLIELDMDTDYYTVMLAMILRGIGLGLFVMTATTLGMATIPTEQISRATSLNSSLRQISGSFGVAVLTSILQVRQANHLAHGAESINLTSLSARAMLVHLESHLKALGEPPGATGHIFTYLDATYLHSGYAPGLIQTKALALLSTFVQQQAYIFAFDDAFFVLTLICFCGILPAALLDPAKHRKAMSDAGRAAHIKTRSP